MSKLWHSGRTLLNLSVPLRYTYVPLIRFFLSILWYVSMVNRGRGNRPSFHINNFSPNKPMITHLLALTAGFIIGVLFARKNAKTVEIAVAEAKVVATKAQTEAKAIAAKTKKR